MLSVVMPVYNEGAVIRENLRRTAAEFRPLGPFEIIPVDDGSADNSAAELQKAAAEIPEVHPLLLPHRGKGEALRQGTRAARGEWVVFLDADLDLPPDQITLFLTLQKVHQADAVIGSKMHPDSNVDYPFVRRIYSRGYYLLVKFLFGLPVRDTQTGMKLVRREILTQAVERTQLDGFAFDLELLVHLVETGAKMTEAPVVVNHQIKYRGVGVTDIYSIACDTWRTWRKVRRMRKAAKQ
jgi:glycosyltransferase involved in cell wall biosynthesis